MNASGSDTCKLCGGSTRGQLTFDDAHRFKPDCAAALEMLAEDFQPDFNYSDHEE